MNERPKKCSQQSGLKVMEEQFLQGAKSGGKNPTSDSWWQTPPRGFTGRPWVSLLATLTVKESLVQLSPQVCGQLSQEQFTSTMTVTSAQGTPEPVLLPVPVCSTLSTESAHELWPPQLFCCSLGRQPFLQVHCLASPVSTDTGMQWARLLICCPSLHQEKAEADGPASLPRTFLVIACGLEVQARLLQETQRIAAAGRGLLFTSARFSPSWRAAGEGLGAGLQHCSCEPVGLPRSYV